MREDWIECTFEDLLDYEQPTNYIVKSTKYSDDYKTPVLTAGKSFIKGYTKETTGIFNDLPTIIFDDFTTATQFVDFEFKVKSSAMKILVPTSKLVNMKFVYNCIQVNQVRNDTHKRYWISVYAKKKILLPPLAEQNAILAKTEEIFSDLDNGIANFKKAKEQLKIYRQAVLKKAFEGELTKEWREKQSNLPTAEELLKQIKQERTKWLDAEILNGNSEAKRIKAKLKKLDIKISNTDLPQNWCWSTFINSCLFVIDCHNKTAPYENEGIFLVRTTNIREGKLDLVNKIKFVSEKTYKYWSRRAYPQSGDIIFTREAPMGEAAIIPKQTKICLGQRTMLLRTISNLLDNKYLFYNIMSEVFQQRMYKDAIGTGVKHLRVGDVENLTFPICAKAEQTQIVAEIEFRLSVCDKMEQSINESIEKAEALRQSILKKAFEGKLLSQAEIQQCKQAADYEPASELLKKIKAEKLAKEQEKKKPIVKQKSKK